MRSRIRRRGRFFRLSALVFLVLGTGEGLLAQGPVEPSPREGVPVADEWELTASAYYLSRLIQGGVDLSEDQPAIGAGAGISHSIGLGLSADGLHTTGSSNLFDQSWVSVTYAHDLSNIVSLSFDYTHYNYSGKYLHALSNLTNSVSLQANVNATPYSISLSFDRYFGDLDANYVGLGLSSYTDWEQLTIVPQVQFDFVAQTVQNRFLSRRKEERFEEKGGMSGTTDVSGLSEIGLRLYLLYSPTDWLEFSLVPSYVYSPTDLSVRTSGFVWFMGLDYTLGF